MRISIAKSFCNYSRVLRIVLIALLFFGDASAAQDGTGSKDGLILELERGNSGEADFSAVFCFIQNTRADSVPYFEDPIVPGGFEIRLTDSVGHVIEILPKWQVARAHVAINGGRRVWGSIKGGERQKFTIDLKELFGRGLLEAVRLELTWNPGCDQLHNEFKIGRGLHAVIALKEMPSRKTDGSIAPTGSSSSLPSVHGRDLPSAATGSPTNPSERHQIQKSGISGMKMLAIISASLVCACILIWLWLRKRN